MPGARTSSGTARQIVFADVYVVALLTTLAPALRASRVHPAQALRFE
jgi:ABC-type lipoprotein release transport system permease subunit